jgi:predicted nucleic acid-binding protein
VAAVFDTTVGVLLLRRKTPADASELIRAARTEIMVGTALLPSSAVAELMVGEKTEKGARQLSTYLMQLPTVILSVEAADYAGAMGGFLSASGASIPFPDLLIAATAIWLDVPLLTWDGDYARSRQIALGSRSSHPGAALWRRLTLHPASRVA